MFYSSSPPPPSHTHTHSKNSHLLKNSKRWLLVYFCTWWVQTNCNFQSLLWNRVIGYTFSVISNWLKHQKRNLTLWSPNLGQMYRFVDLQLFFHTQFGKTGAQYCNYNVTEMTYLAIWWSEPPLNLTWLPISTTS